MWRRDNGPVGLEVVREIESLLNYSFPKEYVEVVLSFNEGHPEPNRFDTQKRKGYVMDRLLTQLNEPLGVICIIPYIKDDCESMMLNK